MYLKDEESIDGVESDEESIFTKSSGKSERERKPETPKPPPVVKVDASIQTTPQVEEKQIWTGEPDYKSYFIVRLIKPSKVCVAKMRCTIKFGNTTYTSKYLDTPKFEKKVKIVDDKRKSRLKMKTEKSTHNKKLFPLN